ncbi:DMT family transporter|uniref:Threonine/homoserine efflux transporter RhtA n=1 Tax=Dendrosporobacter quercicolus TaxID=146817 RepID=A0A1G9N817_9FIRM|nr:DMT family transporter [Dendrosporobacter quercicolus]NSL47258.1 DMT family transporter [Dendrosporobacter quercicolus DSM 1736]SDL82564.1 Threonine/homoserine efflux transporter RhtA [Dendrosporobacter quercicolus]
MTQRKADLLIATVSIAWGTSYLLMKLGLNGIGPFSLIALRFGIAFLVTFSIFFRRVIKADVKIIGYSAVLGLILFGIFTVLMYGLKTTTVSSAGFLTSVTVIFVPILQSLITRKRPTLPIAGSVLIILIGIGLLTIKASFVMENGSILCVLGAFLYAVHIILTSSLVQEISGLQLGIFQLGFAALYGVIFSCIFEIPALPSNTTEWIAVLGLALVCSAYGFVVQPIAQKFTTPERAGILFALEPVCSALFGFVFLQEMLQLQGYVGAMLVLCGVLISGIKEKDNKDVLKTGAAD